MQSRSREPWSPAIRRWLPLAVLALVLGVLQRIDRQPTVVSPLGGHPRLVDGDSFHLGADEVRLLGIDAPEGRQTCQRNGTTWRCGEEARDQLSRLIAGRSISCESRERDQHGRLLAVCRAEETELNAAMVASGYAVSFGTRYGREEREARQQRLGLWAGEFERPQDWRRDQGIGH